jgi:nucleotide-binding universal stress UspA family protein
MFKKILMALDGSELSEGIIPFVEELAKAGRGQVTVLYVSNPEENPALAKARFKGTTPASYLNGVVGNLKDAGVAADSLELSGKPAEEIVNLAKKKRYDLIAMSTHGRSGIGRLVYGSTTDKVIHATGLPMLLNKPQVKKAGNGSLRVTVVPLDGSELGESVLPTVEEFASRLAMSIALIRVVPTASMAFAGVDPQAYDPRMNEYMMESASEYLKERSGALKSRGVKVTTKAVRGDAANNIIDYAGDMPGSLIVMSTHGRSGVGRFVLGSVADRVLRASPRPVLLLRP